MDHLKNKAKEIIMFNQEGNQNQIRDLNFALINSVYLLTDYVQYLGQKQILIDKFGQPFKFCNLIKELRFVLPNVSVIIKQNQMKLKNMENLEIRNDFNRILISILYIFQEIQYHNMEHSVQVQQYSIIFEQNGIDLKVQISAQEKNKDKVKEPIIYLTRSRNMSSFSFPIIKEIEKTTIFQWISQMGEQDQQVLDQSMSCNNFYFNIYTDILKISQDHLIKSIMRVSDSVKSSINKINNNNSGQQSKMQQNLPAIQDEGDLELEGDEITNKNIQIKNPYLSPKKQNEIQLLDIKDINLKEQQIKQLLLLQNNSINKQNQLNNQEHHRTLSDAESKDLINKILYQVESKKADSQPQNFNSNSNVHNTNYSQKNCFNFKSLDISEHMSSIKGVNQNFNHFPQISADETHANQLLHNSFHTNFLKNQEQNSSQYNNNQIQFQNIHIPSLSNNNLDNNKDNSKQDKLDEKYQKHFAQNQGQNECNLQNQDEQISQNSDQPKNQFNQCYNLQNCDKINQTSLLSNFSNLIKTDDFIIQKPQIIKHLQPVQPGKILKAQQQQFLNTQLNQNLTKNNDIKNDINIFNIFSDQQLKYKTQDLNLTQNKNYHNQSVQSINSSHCQQSNQFLESKMTDQN